MFITPHTDTGVFTSSRFSSVKKKMLDKYKDNVRELKTEEEVMEAYLDEQCKEIYVLSDLNGNGSRPSLLTQLESRGFPQKESPKVTWVVFDEKDRINNHRLELSHANIIYHEGDPNDLDIVEQLMTKIDLPPVQRSSTHHRYHSAPEATGEAVDHSSYQSVSPIREDLEFPTPPIGNVADQHPENPRATVSQPVKATPPLASDSKLQDSNLEKITLLLEKGVKFHEKQLKQEKVKYQENKEHQARMEVLAKKSTDVAQQQVSLLGGALVDTGLSHGPQEVSENPEDKEHKARMEVLAKQSTGTAKQQVSSLRLALVHKGLPQDLQDKPEDSADKEAEFVNEPLKSKLFTC